MTDRQQAIIVTVDAVRTRASTNEALVTFAVPLEQANLIATFMGRVGQQIGAAFADVGQQTVLPPKQGSGDYGDLARDLKLSVFFRRPEVWKAVGTDAEFLEWCRGQKCVVCGDGDYDGETGELRNQSAHVRRVANGAGTATKPEYSAVTMCNHDHNLAQHQHGESEAYRRYLEVRKHESRGRARPELLVSEAKAWFERQRIEFLQGWCWQTLKADLGYDSWAHVPPERLHAWVVEKGLPEQWLPEGYRS